MKLTHLLLALSLLSGGTAAAQNATTPVSATQIMIGNTPITTGLVSVSPVNFRGDLIPLTTVDGKLYLPGAFSANIVAGAFSGLNVPDQCTAVSTIPNTPIYMRVDYVQTANGKPTGLTGTFTSPPSAPFFCGSTPVAIDHYSAPQTVQVSSAGIVSTSSVPAHCTSPSLYYPNSGSNPVVRVCIAGAFVAVNTAQSGDPQITWSGTWSSVTAYTANQAVFRSGSTYVALQASTNQDPATASAYWQLVAQKGADGTNGTNGTNGANGSDAVVGSYVFSAFPSNGLVTNKTMVIQTDAVVGSSCTQGGGTARRICLYNGTAWVPADNFAAEKGVANGVASLDVNAQLPSTQLPVGLISVAQIGTLWGNWDSYGYGNGPQNPARYAPFQLVSADVPAPFINLSYNGATMAGISNNALTFYRPNDLGLPDVALVGAGENDGPCASATATCGYSFKEMKLGNLLHWLIPPTYTNSIFASNAAKSGTTSNDTAIYGTFGKTAAGYPVTLSSSGATLTFSIPSSSATKVHIHYIAKPANTGTFTASITDSSGTTNLVDESTGTNTFSSAPLGSVPAIPTYGLYTQEFTVTPNQAHTVTITTLSASPVEIARVTWNAPAAASPKNMVFDYNVSPVWTPQYAAWNAIDAALDSDLRSQGFLVGTVDLANGTSTSSTQWSAINPVAFPQAGVPYNAADFSTSATSTCTASRNANHPNECGAMDFYRNFLNAQVNLGIVFSRVSLGGKYTEQTGTLYAPTNLVNPKNNPTLKDLIHNAIGYGTYSGTNFVNAVIGWQDASTAGSKPWSQKYMQGPVSGPATNFWWCGAGITSYSDAQTYASGNLAVQWCDDPAGNAYRNILVQPVGGAIASAATIPPTTALVHVTGTAAISAITPPPGVCDKAGFGCTITLIPDGAWTLAPGGTPSATSFTFVNASTAVVGKPMALTCDVTAQRCYASY